MLLLIIMMTTMGSMPFVFSVCHFGEMVSMAIGELHGAIYKMSWLACPVELQRQVVPMLVYAERPFYFDGVLLVSSHETFKKVTEKMLCLKHMTLDT